MALSYSFHLSNKGHSLTSINKVKSVSKHNLRTFSKTEIYNKNDIEILVGSNSILDDVKKIYKEEFDECLANYNAKQKREDRKIKNYLNHISNSRSDVAAEIIIQLGDMEFWQDKTEEEKRKMSYLFKDQVKYLNQIMPNFKIASAVVHYDESSPHLHLVGVPIADGYKKGLEKQVAKTKLFTKDTLVKLQDVMRERIQKGIEFNKDIFGDEVVKEKEKGRNKDLPKESLIIYNRLKVQNDNLEQRIAENRRILHEIEKNRLEAQNEAQKVKEEQTQLQKNIEFLKAEEEKLLQTLSLEPTDINFDDDIIDDDISLVANKLKHEYKRYLKLLKNYDKDYIADRSFETYYKENIVWAVGQTDFSEEETELLLGKENLLEEFYNEWMDFDVDELQDYLDFTGEVKNKILSKILDERPKSLLERAKVQKEKSKGYEPEI